MGYQLTVIKRIPNPFYEAEMEKLRRTSNWNEPIPVVPQELESRSLTVDLTDEEWLELKRELIKIFDVGGKDSNG